MYNHKAKSDESAISTQIRRDLVKISNQYRLILVVSPHINVMRFYRQIDSFRDEYLFLKIKPNLMA